LTNKQQTFHVKYLKYRGVKLIFVEGHISIMVPLKGPVVTELTTIIYYANALTAPL